MLRSLRGSFLHRGVNSTCQFFSLFQSKIVLLCEFFSCDRCYIGPPPGQILLIIAKILLLLLMWVQKLMLFKGKVQGF